MRSLLVMFVVLSAGAVAQDGIPPGTIIPAELNTSLNSRKSKPGQTVTARIMQDVLLPAGTKIRAGAKLVGHVEAVEHSGAGAQISVRFDEIKFAHRSIPVNTSLRALASLMDVEDTQVPTTGPDRGTPWAWTNRNLIGGEVAYGEGGPVARGTVTVGRSLLDGAIMPAQPNPAAGCPSEPYDSGQPQAFWVFSDDACGIYGVDGVQISHAGRTSPAGVFTLSTQRGAFDVRAGSGILLRAN